uniref:Uncharacterized protein n=1 Tax=Plectus sambesii TaxID=2011161 RepID=A0A914XND5_9BILA
MPHVERSPQSSPPPPFEAPSDDTKFAKTSLSPRSSHRSESSEDEWPLWSLADDPHQQFHTETFHHQSLEAINESEESAQKLINGPGVVLKSGFHRSISESGAALNDPLADRQRTAARWQNVARRARSLRDPWYRFHLTDLPTEECVRHYYSSIRKEWWKDTVQVKMHPEPFARGAMRECFRLKKLSKFTKSENWETAMN